MKITQPLVSGAYISKYRRRLTAIGKKKRFVSKSLHQDSSKSAKAGALSAFRREIGDESMHRIINDINDISYVNKKKNYQRKNSPMIEDEQEEESAETHPQEENVENESMAYRRLNSILKKRNLSLTEIQVPQTLGLPSKFSDVLKSAGISKGSKSGIFRIKDSKVSFPGLKDQGES
jgi:hypothetical protein